MPSPGRLTIPNDEPLSEDERLRAEPYPDDPGRPVTRGDCIGGPRPCPYVSCSHHLYLEVDPRTGSLKLVFPGIEPWQMRESCALDVADRGGATLDVVGRLLRVTRERIRQVEERALPVLRAALTEDEP